MDLLKSKFVGQLASLNPHLGHKDVRDAVDILLAGIIRAVANGERVELRGFGVFSVRADPVRMVRNPKTGETRLKEQTYRVHFKPGKHLKERIISSCNATENRSG